MDWSVAPFTIARESTAISQRKGYLLWFQQNRRGVSEIYPKTFLHHLNRILFYIEVKGTLNNWKGFKKAETTP